MKPGIVIVIGIVAVVGAVALLVGFLIGGDTGSNGPMTPAEQKIASLEEELAREKSAKERVEAALESRLAEGTAAAARLPGSTAPDAHGQTPADPTAAAPAPVEGAGARVRFFAHAYGGALAKVDWKMVGANLAEMNPLIVEIVHSIRAGERPEGATIGRIQQLNGPLLAAALMLPDDVPGVGVNGKFSDPGFMVNAMASCLAAAKLPLTTQQEADLVAVAEKWMTHDARRRERYDETTYALEKIFEEAELKDGYFAEALGLLTAEQRGVVDPEETHDRVQLALFSSSLIYAGRVEVFLCPSTEDLKAKYLRRTEQIFDLSDSDRELARPIVESWVDSIPAAVFEAEADALDRSGLVQATRVTTWAKLVHDLVRQVVDRLPLDETRRETARSIGGVYLPLKVE